ncbi:hypothetical protein PC116_g23759 [Phytophthora cactorum]|nr:hypothetical protein C6341_g25473 [Phytophthora cactorum]KAG4227863.1 hypothetical protein PC116_g23759 [Phytophthora cactorum]
MIKLKSLNQSAKLRFKTNCDRAVAIIRYAPRSSTPPLIDLVDFNEVHWNQLPKQLGTWFGIFIVEFSYDLDIAAIELDMGISLVFNPELKAVNWSNVVSDRLGGYTGSYILL